MIKSVAYFPDQCALNSIPVMSNMLQSLSTRGIQSKPNDWNCDAAVIWSVLWHGRMKANQSVYQHYRVRNKPVIIVEIGTLLRGITWKISVNHINALGYYGHKDNIDYNRPKFLRLQLGKISKRRPEILIAAQHSKSLLLQGIDQTQWINQTVIKLRQHTDRSIIVRPHPRSSVCFGLLVPNIVVQVPTKILPSYDHYDLDVAYHAVVNFNSGPGTLAAIAGTRPMVDETSLAFPVGIDPTQIENDYVHDRYQWFVEICHTEYTLDEIANGVWLDRLATELKGHM